MNIDIAIIFAYFLLINIIGLKYSGSSSVNDYFLGNRNVHWVLACFSIIATETSSLTFLSIPGLAYVKGAGFLQVTFGYLLGRTMVAVLLLPRLFQGKYDTVYQFLQKRFSPSSQKIVSIVFHITRLMADSVRLFATAIPLTLLMGWDYRLSLAAIGGATLIYTFYGGLKSVVVVDALQLFIYIIGALIGLYVIGDHLSLSFVSIFNMIPAPDLAFLSTGTGGGWSGIFNSYNLFSGIIGGAFLSFASHGTDHILVQRVLSCSSVRSAQKAMVFSGVLIIFQFALFLLWGLFIKVMLQGRAFARSDEIIPYFIINYVPTGMRGIMLAGIFAAAMSTLASSINSLSSSTSLDLLGLPDMKITEKRKVGISRLISLCWAVVIIGVSMLFRHAGAPLIEIGLSIASITYGSMMGIFLLGRFSENISEKAALAGLIVSIAVMSFIAAFTAVFWLWYVVIGFLVSLISSLALRRFLR